MTRLRCAILDDYHESRLDGWRTGRRSATASTSRYSTSRSLRSEAAARALKDFEIICAMRERTPFPRALFAALPKLKLLITSGMRNAAIDMEAAKEHEVVLCGTQWVRDPTAPLTMGLILELTRNIGRENARMHAGEPWQKFVGDRDRGQDARRGRPRQARRQGAGLAKAFGMKVIAWSPNLTPERLQGGRRRLRHQGRIVRDRRHHHHPRRAEPALARPGRRATISRA